MIPKPTPADLERDAELLPCPFCGSKIVGLLMMHDGFFDPSDKAVQCGVCGASGPSLIDTHAEGIVGWNKRVAAEAALAESVPLEEALAAVLGAGLPEGYQWGSDAMEQFNFGKRRAADALRQLAARRGKGNGA